MSTVLKCPVCKQVNTGEWFPVIVGDEPVIICDKCKNKLIGDS